MRCIAFEGYSLIALGEFPEVAQKTKAVLDRGARPPVLIFDTETSEPIEVDWRGTVADVLGRFPQAQNEANPVVLPRGPGRPKLGVVAREVTLLPQHWDWLNSQPGGASVALRKLVHEARRANEPKDRHRQMQDSAYRFMVAMAGNLPGYQEALRALYAGNQEQFHQVIEPWPIGVRDHTKALVAAAFPGDVQ